MQRFQQIQPRICRQLRTLSGQHHAADHEKQHGGENSGNRHRNDPGGGDFQQRRALDQLVTIHSFQTPAFLFRQVDVGGVFLELLQHCAFAVEACHLKFIQELLDFDLVPTQVVQVDLLDRLGIILLYVFTQESDPEDRADRDMRRADGQAELGR